MNAYRPHVPRVTLALAAAALTIATLAVSVIAPSRMDFRSQQVETVVLSQAARASTSDAAPAPVDSIDVVASRDARLVTVVESRRVQQQRLRS
ncbi:MAG: hypothetical protein ABI190_05795 [Casimicrobiaceae bacterium]